MAKYRGRKIHKGSSGGHYIIVKGKKQYLPREFTEGKISGEGYKLGKQSKNKK